jgi:hypothetical protein
VAAICGTLQQAKSGPKKNLPEEPGQVFLDARSLTFHRTPGVLHCSLQRLKRQKQR